MNAMNLTMPQLQTFLNYCANRAKSMTGNILVKGQDGKMQVCSLSTELPKFFSELLQSTNDPKKIAERNEFLTRALTDPKVHQQLCALRVETFNNFVYATQNIIDFYFETVTLLQDERPAESNTTQNEIKCYYNGPEGNPKMVKIDREDEHELKNLHYLTTEPVRYKKVDIYRGTIVDAALQTINLAYDWKNKAEGIAFALLTNGSTIFGNFTFTGKKQNYPYVANSRINTDNLPTSNDLAVTGISGSTNLELSAFDKVIGYCAKWAGSNPANELKPTGRVLVPGSDLETFGSTINAVGAKPTVPAEKILADGWVGVHYKGVDWVLIPDNTLAPGTMYPELNIKPGRVFYKPSLDKEETKDVGQNEQEKVMQKVIGFSLNSANRRNICRVKYRS
ncbi:MAG: hypothetical protein ACTHLW_00985 [Verrucomicrobiota bacterium]